MFTELPNTLKSQEPDVLVRVENISKKFCKSLKRSLWYGMRDMTTEMFGGGKHDDLRKDEFWAVKDVSFELKRGECLGLIGHNGAGKSTLLKMLNGLIKPDQGRIEMHGRIGALIELGAGFNPILTGRENIYNKGAILGFTKKEVDRKFDEIVDFAEIEEFIDMPVQNYSSGMKVRLGFAVSAQMDPDVLIIDEVLAVGDIGFRIKCMNAIRQLIRNSTVIFVSHSMPQVSMITTQAMLMQHGCCSLYSNAVPEVVLAYFQNYEKQKSSNNFSEGAQLINIQINVQNENGWAAAESGQVPVFAWGDNLGITLDLDLAEDVKNIAIRVSIINLEMRPIAVVDSQASSFMITSNKKIKMFVEIKNICLNSGKYYINLFVTDFINARTLLRADSCAEFSVRLAVPAAADFMLDCEWKQII